MFVLVASTALTLTITGCEETGHAERRASALVAGRRVIIGRSVDGRPIHAVELGDPAAVRRLLVVGCIHGNERAGQAVTRRLRTAALPAGVTIWAVDQFNPDGCKAGTRENAHGVDLNRNSPWYWRRLRGEFYSGTQPLSEPESRAIYRFVRCVEPQVSV